MQRSDIELTAPVGSFESLMAAIQGNADSVYFGVAHLNMRSKSSVNFTLDDLTKIVSICKEHKIKAYLTLNTVVFDEEVELSRQIMNAAKSSGVNAIIASDQGIIAYAMSIGLNVHLSTQLNISNTETLRFFAQYADIMVMARELSLKQVAVITKNIKEQNINGPSGKPVKIEIFAHGALCMAISGKCYLSLHENNHSANRGTCLQTCRKAYIVTAKETGSELEIDNEYIMSPKDLCTIGFLDQIINSGVTVLKLEGRARAPEYVKTVTQCYHEAIEACCDGSYTSEKIAIWNLRLSQVFNRGFWDGYYLGKRIGEWSNKYGSVAKKRKEYIGKVINYFSKLKVAEILIEAGSLNVNEDVLIIGSTTGVEDLKVEELRVNLVNVQLAKQGELVSLPVTQIVRRSDKIYRLVDTDE